MQLVLYKKRRREKENNMDDLVCVCVSLVCFASQYPAPIDPAATKAIPESYFTLCTCTYSTTVTTATTSTLLSISLSQSQSFFGSSFLF